MNTMPSKEQQKRSAADIFAAFEYQWDYFVLILLQKGTDRSTMISFELFDDVAIQQDNNVVLCQVKHSVRKNSFDETINMSNRDVDLWKTISIWIKLIEENVSKSYYAYINNTEFHLISNKKLDANDFVVALRNYHNDGEVSKVKDTLNSILNSGKYDSEVSKLIDNFLKCSYFNQFINKIRIISTSDCLKTDIFNALHDRAFIPTANAQQVYNTLMTELRDDVIEKIKHHEKIEFSGQTFSERFQTVFVTGRQKINFRINYDYSLFDGDPTKLLFIQQLDAIKELPEEGSERLDQIIQYAKEWFQFSNNLQNLTAENILLDEDIMKLSADVHTYWNARFQAVFRRIPSASPEEMICDAGCQIVDDMRQKEFNIANTSLGNMLSNGCIYYYSNTPTAIIPTLPHIGWHRNWKNKFKKL
ncbi:DUF4297 domain-containing protein [uncultured Bacteroides sp.]|uniref:DUF4297 domain-containing protein n=1 Tax=uncultured Bacteroides sp. TaxID=162156 RepID=UPI002603FCAD|nr:DUF4297 domain-containing protein [uncultured Bacteroides sp.]